VADAGEHGGALLDLAFDAPLHDGEGLAGAAHLARPGRLEVADGAALAEALGGVGEALDRADLIAQEEDGDGQQHEGGADHPDQEDVRVRGIGLGAAGDDAENVVAECDADLDQVGVADGVDPEGPMDTGDDLVGERAVEQREERLRPRRRQLLAAQDGDREAEIALGDARHGVPVGVLRVGLDHRDDRGDVAGQSLRQAAGDEVPVTLHEDVGDHRLQDDHRQHDDQERAAVEALGHAFGDGAGEAPPGEAGADHRLVAQGPQRRGGLGLAVAHPGA